MSTRLIEEIGEEQGGQLASNSCYSGRSFSGIQVKDLVNTSFKNVRFEKETLFWNCSVRHCDFSETSGLSQSSFPGCDLTGSSFPESISFGTIETIKDSARAANATMFTFLTASLYGVSVILVEDFNLVSPQASFKLPLVGAELSAYLFFTICPLLMLLLFLYFQMTLRKLYHLMGTMPSILPSGTAMDQELSSWLFTDMILMARTNLQDVAYFQSVRLVLRLLAGWASGPLFIFILWLKTLILLNRIPMYVNLLLFIFTTMFSIISFVVCIRSIGLLDKKKKRKTNIIGQLLDVVGPFCLLVVPIICLKHTATIFIKKLLHGKKDDKNKKAGSLDSGASLVKKQNHSPNCTFIFFHKMGNLDTYLKAGMFSTVLATILLFSFFAAKAFGPLSWRFLYIDAVDKEFVKKRPDWDTLGDQDPQEKFPQTIFDHQLFVGANLQYSFWGRARLDGTDFAKADLKYANFDWSTGDATRLSKADLGHTSFRHSRLTNTGGSNPINGARINFTIFSKARLEGFTLSPESMTAVNLTSATLKDVNINNEWKAQNSSAQDLGKGQLLSMEKAILIETEIEGSTFTNINFTGSDFSGSKWNTQEKTNLESKSTLDTCTLTDVDFCGAELYNLVLKDVTILNSENKPFFKRLVLRNSVFNQCDLTRISFEEAKAIEDCELTGGSLSEVTFSSLRGKTIFREIAIDNLKFSKYSGRPVIEHLVLENSDLTHSNLSNTHYLVLEISNMEKLNDVIWNGSIIEKFRLNDTTIKDSFFIDVRFGDISLKNAIIFNTDFSRVRFTSGASQNESNNIHLENVEFNMCNFSGADLNGIKGWESASFLNSNIDRVKNAPDGFIKHALSKGAVDLDPILWITYKNDLNEKALLLLRLALYH